jgi:hypothetical protein
MGRKLFFDVLGVEFGSRAEADAARLRAIVSSRDVVTGIRHATPRCAGDERGGRAEARAVSEGATRSSFPT